MAEEQAWEYDAFISYSRRDEGFVSFLEQSLRLSGLRCFRDVSGLDIFDKLDASLKGAIARSRWLIAVISPAYLQSYWCLFEALEALQGQDLALRFLPVAAQYSPDDQTLDEAFVFRALADLREQIRLLEGEIIASRAYAMSAKLDKLSFVQNNLPKIFTQIRERIYPVFRLWDEPAVRATTADLLYYCKAPVRVDLDSVAFNPGALDATTVVVPRLRSLPTLVWKADVGCQAWRNTPVVAGNDVLVGSSGRRWNEPDDRDGVVCLHAETGRPRWFAPTPADANAILVSKGLVLTGCDDGTVAAFRLLDGRPQWSVKLPGAIVGGPIKLPSNIGSGLANRTDNDARDPVLFVTYHGEVCILDLTTGGELARVEVGAPVLAPPTVMESRWRDCIAVPLRDGVMAFVSYSSIHISLGLLRSAEVHFADEYAESGYSAAQLEAQPASVPGIVVQGFARHTYFPDPPIVALDAETGAVRWMARDPDGGGYGNMRCRPAIVDGEVIFTTAYSNALHAVSLDNGAYRWSVPLGQPMFEHWSSPVVSGRSVFIGRHDGYLHKVSLERRQREWSIYLGDADRAGMAVGAGQDTPEFDDTSSWIAGGSSPILSTPAVDRGRLYAGTQQGWLYCIANL